MSFKLSSLLFLLAASSMTYGQNNNVRSFTMPVQLTPTYLSGNFGELRSNHFHGGLDFKTRSSTGWPIYCFADGWVSRIGVSPSGYGNALYVTHPNGLTTVYAHLEEFSPDIYQYVRNYQYENETFQANIFPQKGELSVREGDVIAKSGNSGSSGGPHLHFEIRDTATEAPMDPLPFFCDKITDTKAPRIQNIYFYPIGGIVNGQLTKVATAPVKREDGSVALNKGISAWGRIGIGVKAYDYMNDTSNKYGVKEMKLYMNDTLIYSSLIDKVPFDQTRYINSFTDYEEWDSKRSMIMKTFIEPGNKLGVYHHTINNGYIDINQEKPYSFRVEVSDAYGNLSYQNFTVNGVIADLPVKTRGEHYMPYSTLNRFNTDQFDIEIPEGALYTDLDFQFSQSPSEKYYSDVFTALSSSVPLQIPARVEIKFHADSTMADTGKYYIGLLKNNRLSYLPTTYKNGTLSATTRTLGSFTVGRDVTKPVITPYGRDKWRAGGKIRFKISDSQSGIKTYKGYIDGRFAIFEYDAKTAMLVCKPDKSRMNEGSKHELMLIVTDNCGNENIYNENINW